MNLETPKTVNDCLVIGSQIIQSNPHIESAWLDAGLLFAFAGKISRAKLLANLNKALSDIDLVTGDYRKFIDLCALRASGLALAYITGTKEFFGRDFMVSQSVLIPRPDTEILVEWIIEDWQNKSSNLSIVDCCTGSGCIGISVALELNHPVIACDISPEALEIARQNSISLSADQLIKFFGMDLLAGLPCPPESVDIICSNPPYVPLAESQEKLALGWGEPLLALNGGADGLDIIRRLAEQAIYFLKTHGCLYMEIGDHQTAVVTQALRDTGFSEVTVRSDLSGMDRIVRASRKGYYIL